MDGIGIYGRQGLGSGIVAPPAGFTAGLHGDAANGDGVVGSGFDASGAESAFIAGSIPHPLPSNSPC